MRYMGNLAQWNDARGFGFVQADGGGPLVFVHISAFQPKPAAHRRPDVGQRVEFSVAVVDGKQRAERVHWQLQKTSPSSSPAASAGVNSAGISGSHTAPRERAKRSVRSSSDRPKGGGQYFVLALFAVIFLVVAWLWGVPQQVALWYVCASAVTFVMYWKDKAAAQAGRWRTPENSLHGLALLGGWPGALLAQQWLRHKSSKAQFRAVFWLTVLINVAGFVWLHSPLGRQWLLL